MNGSPDSAEAAELARVEQDVAVMARQVGLTVPGFCMPGVVANTQLLRSYTTLVDDLVLPDTCEPAFGYTP